ncbi:MAG: metallophosphoesterase N-terminal domain-containing protein, partial [Tannerellaceae bacterium]
MKTTTLRKATLFCFAASLVACAANAQDYSGKVYNDTNKNGQFDKGEKPLSGVLVTDGLNVVKTDKEGTFSLPGHPKARFIYITSPSGYMAPSKHYIPVSEKNDTYNFGLVTYVAEDAKGNHNFVQISDTEISDPNQGDWVKNLHDYAAAEKAAFIVHTGDICYEKGLNSHIQILNNESLTCPMYYCIGNHDLVKGK